MGRMTDQQVRDEMTDDERKDFDQSFNDYNERYEKLQKTVNDFKQYHDRQAMRLLYFFLLVLSFHLKVIYAV